MRRWRTLKVCDMLGTVSGSISEQRIFPELPIPQRANVLGVGIHSLNLESAVELMEAAVLSQARVAEAALGKMVLHGFQGVKTHQPVNQPIQGNQLCPRELC